jgi:serine/threonine-protein kinase
LSSQPPPQQSHRGFFAGLILAGRYRIVDRIGQGGMGDVYRADDLVLDQPVALKFLPREVENDPERLDRLRAEVRVARQIAHPNVCRVYDINNVDGHTFLTMEYIDGENLKSLLRRIGRLPHDTALDMSRQLCAGLAAAHDKGILHRDLKPANVMIDGSGRVKLADFGIASLATETDALGFAGTPAYMAPEQFDHQSASKRSDIYALGLVLYEMFAGTPAFDATSIAELARLHRETTPAPLSQVTSEAGATVERVIQRCLAKDPADRPASSIAVAAALPGGDRLAAALAAGETPAPELVAAAGGIGAIAPWAGAAMLAAFVVGLFIVVALSRSTQVIRYLPLTRSPEVLADQARSLLARLKFNDPPADVASGFTSTGYAEYLRAHDQSPTRWENLRVGQPPAYVYWYRQSPRRLATDRLSLGGRVTPTDPPEDVPGMVTVMLDAQGRLHQFSAVPALVQRTGLEPPDWTAFFREAGLDIASLTPTAPSRIPPMFVDGHSAWDGAYSDNPSVRVHVEAAGAFGRPTFFRIYYPWDPPDRVGNSSSTSPIAVVLVSVLLLSVGLLARRNMRLRRGDRTGAVRLALGMAVLHIAAGFLTATQEFDFGDVFPILAVTGGAGLSLGALAWLTYLALEPDLRRRAPPLLISWSRFLGGRLRDPLVGRDLLIGLTVGAGTEILWQLHLIAPQWVGQPPNVSLTTPARGLTDAAAAVVGGWTTAVLVTTVCALVLLLLHVVVRRWLWVGVAFFVVLGLALFSTLGWSVSLPFRLLILVAFTLVMTRIGLLAFVAMNYVNPVLDHVPMTFERVWYAPQSWLALAALVSLAVFGYRTSVAGQPLFAGASSTRPAREHSI